MIRVLHILGTMDIGGIESFIMNLYRNMDRTIVQFDFIVNSNSKKDYYEEINRLGGNIYEVTPISKNIFKRFFELKKIFKSNLEYKIVHRHACSAIVFFDLLVAKLYKIKKVIVHSHSNMYKNRKLLNKILSPLVNLFADKKLACSKTAAEWLFGSDKDVEIIYNGIDIDKFTYDINIRNIIRNKLECDKKFIIGNVGRLSWQKNQSFILDIFEKYLKTNINAELWLIGDGDERESLSFKAKKLNIENNVKFFGNTNNINNLLQAMDLFLFPSIKEGLGISLIEAQINGLKCIISPEVPKEAIITDKIKVISLDRYDLWINEISKEDNTRTIDTNINSIRDFNIINTIMQLKKVYDI